jgi:hypothetical protein
LCGGKRDIEKGASPIRDVDLSGVADYFVNGNTKKLGDWTEQGLLRQYKNVVSVIYDIAEEYPEIGIQ